jgi:hypothetical protein
MCRQDSIGARFHKVVLPFEADARPAAAFLKVSMQTGALIRRAPGEVAFGLANASRVRFEQRDKHYSVGRQNAHELWREAGALSPTSKQTFAAGNDEQGMLRATSASYRRSALSPT